MQIADLIPANLTANNRLLDIERTISAAERDTLRQRMVNGLCEPALVLNDGPQFLVAVQCRLLNTCIFLRFSKKMSLFLSDNYGIKKGHHLLAVNTYLAEGNGQPDITRTKNFCNVHPIIAETLADSKNQVIELKRQLGADTYHNFKDANQSIFEQKKKYVRCGIPSISDAVEAQEQNNILNLSQVISEPDIVPELDQKDEALESANGPDLELELEPDLEIPALDSRSELEPSDGDIGLELEEEAEPHISSTNKKSSSSIDPFEDLGRSAFKPIDKSSKDYRRSKARHKALNMWHYIYIFPAIRLISTGVANSDRNIFTIISAYFLLGIMLLILLRMFYNILYIIWIMIRIGPRQIFLPFICGIVLTCVGIFLGIVLSKLLT